MIGDRLKRARKAAGLSTRALGELAGVGAMAISKYETGKSVPSSGVLLNLSKALGVKVEYFFRPLEVSLQEVEYLFKLLRQYRPSDTELLCQVKLHEQALGVPANTIAQRIEYWRNNVVAHLTLNGMNPSFFEENRIALSELKAFLHQIDGAVQFFSQLILNRTNDTITAARQQNHDIRNLFRGAGAEPRAPELIR